MRVSCCYVVFNYHHYQPPPKLLLHIIHNTTYFILSIANIIIIRRRIRSFNVHRYIPSKHRQYIHTYVHTYGHTYTVYTSVDTYIREIFVASPTHIIYIIYITRERERERESIRSRHEESCVLKLKYSSL